VNQWYELLEKATWIEKLICEQRQLMDEFDPQRRIGLLIDEWGAWHLPTPGRNPHHLWQQNTLRDALVAAITLDTFNRHADKLVMANIAQMANVLQAMVLTEGDRMLLTPTYHVFDLYRPHQGATSLRVEVDSPTIRFPVGPEKRQLPALMASASLRGDQVLLTVVNPHASLPIEAKIDLKHKASHISSSVLAHDDLNAHNTFDEPQRVELVIERFDSDLDTAVFSPRSATSLQIRITGPVATKDHD
ncbi:MAG TPA: alpha-L-arabinofuranosidase C-terminal domain-containing protein, partial [Tepidisphaeraceae bacterium]|nr:alpha-L-arabinofuranosidase C-terminal domain-containing protein [Tepidisphaeraceae bacterium]